MHCQPTVIHALLTCCCITAAGDLGSCFEGGKFKFPGTLFLGSNPTIWRISSPVWAKYFAMG